MPMAINYRQSAFAHPPTQSVSFSCLCLFRLLSFCYSFTLFCTYPPSAIIASSHHRSQHIPRHWIRTSFQPLASSTIPQATPIALKGESSGKNILCSPLPEPSGTRSLTLLHRFQWQLECNTQTCQTLRRSLLSLLHTLRLTARSTTIAIALAARLPLLSPPPPLPSHKKRHHPLSSTATPRTN
ncbi:hypothetical protein EDD21DRAFT_363194 [Dissophora ornata]|nr:hypothetical protein EDD21DRAFT_363194 [Dissophora ornata]